MADTTNNTTVETSVAGSTITAGAATTTHAPITRQSKARKGSIIQYLGTGRRKTSVARVYIRPNGSGKLIINKKHTLQEALGRPELVEIALKPLQVVNQLDKWDIIVNIFGGGVSSQAGAISLGIARALLQSDEAFRITLRKHALLTRDSRMVERKKYGQPGARKKFQFSKR